MIRRFMDPMSEHRRLIRALRPHFGLMSQAVIFEVLRQISSICVAVTGAALFAMAVAGKPVQSLYPYAFGMVFLGICRGAFSYLGPYLAHVAAYRILVSLRDEFYRILEPLAPARLVSRRTGDLVSTAVSDIEMLELFFAHTAGPIAVAVIVPILSLTALAVINLKLAGVLFIFLMLLAMMPRFSLWLGRALGENLRSELARLNSQVLDSLQGMKEILAFGYEESRRDLLSHDTDRLISLQAKQARNSGLQSAASVIILSSGVICILIMASILVSRGELPRSYLPIAVLLSGSVFASLMSVVEISKQLSQAFAGARRLFALLDEEPSVVDHANLAFSDGEEILPSLSLKNVSFSYSPDGPEILKDISFEIPAGTTAALVGSSGAGKSTIISLLLRFWDPKSGQILLGGMDLKSIPLKALRHQFSVVSQDIFLFNDTVRENIRLGRADACDAEVEEAASLARIHDFIKSLPDGYDTVVGERGIRLSGGERQRIAIARALLKDAPILILDEATSSLDTESERAIKDTLMSLREGRTTLIIAHRLSTVVDADEIFVLEGGTVIEHGRHETLLANGGKYARLVKGQASEKACLERS